MSRTTSPWTWTYHLGYKWWEGSRGTGSFVLQHSRKAGKWFAMRKPFLGTPQVLDAFPSREAARKYVEANY